MHARTHAHVRTHAHTHSLSVCPFVCSLSVRPSVSFCLVCLSVCLPLSVPVCLYVYLSASLTHKYRRAGGAAAVMYTGGGGGRGREHDDLAGECRHSCVASYALKERRARRSRSFERLFAWADWHMLSWSSMKSLDSSASSGAEANRFTDSCE